MRSGTELSQFLRVSYLPMSIFRVFWLRKGDSIGNSERGKLVDRRTNETILKTLHTLVGSVQYMCPIVPLCIVGASLSQYEVFISVFKLIVFNLALIVRHE